MPQLDPLEIVAKVTGAEDIDKFTKNIDFATESLNKFQSRVVQTSHATSQGFKDIERSSGHMGRGLLQAAYTIDDLQYGFRAILNNIPQLVMGLGGSAGLAGAIGILAIALSKIEIDWSKFTSGLVDTRGLEGVKTWTEHLADLTEQLINTSQVVNQPGVLDLFEKAGDWLKFMAGGVGMQAQMARIDRRTQRAVEAGEGAENLKTSRQKEQSELFRNTLAEYTQSRLVKEVVDEEVKRLEAQGRKLAGSQVEEIRRKVVERIGYGLEGRYTSDQARMEFGPAFQQAMNDQKNRLMERAMKEDEETHKKAVAQSEKAEQERFRREKAEDDAEAKGAEEAFNEEKMAERHRLQARIKAMHDLYEENAESIRHMGRSEIMSGEEYSRQVTQAGFDSIPNQQLKVQKDIKLAIEKLHDKLAKVNEMRFRKD